MKAYAGIGSRETPHDVLLLMHHIARTLATEGWTLRSGGANGADQAFLSGALGGNVETYLPWPSYEQEALRGIDLGDRKHIALTEPQAWTFPIAAMHHPRWANLKPGAQKLHARNVHQIFGRDQAAPMSRMVVCWTKDGGPTGGTGQALRIAAAHGVEIRNLFNDDTRHAAEMWCMANRDTLKGVA